ncbi:hypothetical protein lerEdw1_018364, partial [Lerista edwardsae]
MFIRITYQRVEMGCGQVKPKVVSQESNTDSTVRQHCILTLKKAMDKQRKPVKSRTFGSNRWKQARGTRRDVSEEESFSSEIVEKVRDIFQELDKNKKGFITRADMQKLEADLPWSAEELELVFDGLDSDSNGRLTIEEFTAGLGHFLSAQTATRERRKRKTASKRAPLNLSLEEADNEEQKCFQAFINQLGADYIFEDQSEIWKMWVQLRQDEPNLLGNLKEFLAKMTHLIKEAKHAKQKLQLILKTQVADHNKEVQQLYEEMEQQIEREKQRLQHESETRSQYHNVEIQEMLAVREGKIQSFLTVQKELETQCLSLKENQHMASSQNQQLKQTNIALEKQLQQTLHQLQETQRHVDAMKSRASQIHQEGGSLSCHAFPVRTITSVPPAHPIACYQVNPTIITAARLVHLKRQHKRVWGKSDCDASSKTLQTPQGLLNDEMICCELETGFYYGPSEDTLDSSAQHKYYHIIHHLPHRAPNDMASVTKVDLSESRTRVISIEEDPLPGSFLEEQQFFLEEASGQDSLLKELNDAIAVLDKMPALQKQSRILPGETSECGALLRHFDLQKRTSETLTSQATSQEDHLLREGHARMQASFESRVEVRTPKPAPRRSLAPEIPSSVYSEMAKDGNVSKKVPVQRDILVLDQVIQPEHCMQVLQCQDTMQAHGRPADSETETIRNTTPEMKTPDSQHSPMKEMPPAHFPAKIVLPKLRAKYKPETLLLENVQLENMPKIEGQAQTTDSFEVSLTKDRGEVDTSKFEKNQEVSTEMNKEANVKPKAQENIAAKASSDGTMDVCYNPDHLYNVLFVGDSNVGKTAFLHRLHSNSFGANMAATIDIFPDRYHSVTKQFFRKADGVVLMYDITSEYSFANMRYWLSCIQFPFISEQKCAFSSQEGAGNGVTILLLGNKTDCIAERRVSTEDGEYLAK